MKAELERLPVGDARRKQLPEVRVLLLSDVRSHQRQAKSFTHPRQSMLKISATA